MKLRAHNLVCVVPFRMDMSERGTTYIRTEDKIRETISKGSEELVEVVEGIDDLCRVCPLCMDDRCQSPDGGEDSCRKWDAILLKGLGVPLGTTLSANEWRRLIKQVSPLDFCQTRCSHRSYCGRNKAM